VRFAFFFVLFMVLAPDRVGAQSGDPTRGEAEASTATEGSSPQAPVPMVAVLMLPTGQIDPAMADSLTELLIAALRVRESGVRIVGKEEFQSQLGRSDAETAACIESPACLGRVGVELGVTEVIAGTLARRMGTSDELVWAFAIQRLDVRTGEMLGRVFREVNGDFGQLLHAIEESFPEIYVTLVRPGRLLLSANVVGAEIELDGASMGRYEGSPLRREIIEPGHHVVRVRASGYRELTRDIEIEAGATLVIEAALEPSRRFVPSALVYAGSAVMVASLALGIGLGVSSQQTPSGSLSMRETIEGFYPARETEALVANVFFGVAGLGAILGVVGIAISGEEQNADESSTTAFSPWLTPMGGDGLMIGAGGRF
jgi:hypothetical protein